MEKTECGELMDWNENGCEKRVENRERIESFAEYLRKEEKSENTIRKYVYDVGKFREFTEEEGKEFLIRYKGELLEKGYAPRSVNSMLASINSYFRFLGHPEWQVKTLKIQREIFRPEEKELTKNEYRKLLTVAKSEQNERIFLILQTICATGIRVSELSYITAEAVRRGEAIVSLKGKTRVIFLVSELRQELCEYMDRAGITEGPVFRTAAGNPVDRAMIWRAMKKLAKDAGINQKKVYPHNLRHLFARTFYDKEKDIVKLSDVLGHSSIETTRIYVVGTGIEVVN